MAKKKKRKIKVKRIGKVLLFLFFLVALIVIGADYAYHNLRDKEEIVEEPVVEEKVPHYYITDLLMVVDALIHSSLFEDARLSDGSYDFKPMLEYIKPIASKYDLA